MKNYQITADELLELIRKNYSEEDTECVHKAIVFAHEAHQHQKRKSGEDYIIHPLAVAGILANMQADKATLVAGILHDVIEDTRFSYEDLKNVFGEEAVSLVDGVTKLHHFHYRTDSKRRDDQANNYRKLLVAITKDFRVLLIKLADRLHNMHTLSFQNEESRLRIARETLDIYAPLANRFGLTKIQNELEDLSIKYLDPEEYKNIARFINETKRERDHYVHCLLPDLKKLFADNGIQAVIYGRAKHIYSIYRKRTVRKVPYDEIYDFVGIRILVDTLEQCYLALTLIHSAYEPVEKLLKDYILRPKPNGYQSLHTVVIGPSDRKIEFQIRTHEMHLYAEEGIAAHWRYKEHKGHTKEVSESESLIWLKDILKKEIGEDRDFIEFLRLKLKSEGIVVVSPQNDYIKLPLDATPLDFAFSIHSEVGLRCIGARVNGKMVPLKTALMDGDMVEIITSAKANPSRDWLTWLKSSHARQKLGAYLRRKEREDAIRLGKDIFEKRCRKLHWKYKTDEEFKALFKLIKVNDKSTLFYLLGTGRMLFAQIKEIVLQSQKPFNPVIEKIEDFSSGKSSMIGIRIGDIHNLMISFASCCHPNPGDEVIGYITRGRGISLHRKNCSNPSFQQLCEQEADRIVQVFWETPEQKNFVQTSAARIKVIGKTRARLLFDMMGVFARYQVMAKEVSREIHGHDIQVIYHLQYAHSSDFDKICSRLKKIPGVNDVLKMS
ncbi:MAG TPA: bifunctional (p)ppGpp synthetase/guanosine-3',5'-bis(diphosphate) 3'-pyrophosphohydrolase [Candidatus Cloacimonadota bacterium]|nr:bifunctional (p)ppGpp synthetase/guanosine-3',5'-bis(diphosphate) 3'-pyrophosphohydrolase [Candidatus Cloacimonadota bacterium]